MGKVGVPSGDKCFSTSTSSFHKKLSEVERTISLLQIEHCQQLEASAPRALYLELCNCGKLQLEWGTMKSLIMGTPLLEIVNGSSETLENFTGIGCVSPQSFPLDLFPTLRTLHLRGFGNLERISQSLVHNHLEELTLKYCLKFESFSGSMHMLLPSLRRLCIQDCPRLKLFPEGGFPSNLQTLTIQGCLILELFPDRGFPSNLKVLRIFNCSRLVGSLKGAFTDNSSLKILCIGKIDAKCFPDEGFLPLSLTSLSIFDCPNLEKLDYKGLHQLSSLKELNLRYCPNLQGLPEEGLSKSISKLGIHCCPLLKSRCQKRGEDWEKIAQIKQHMYSNDDVVFV
ncbi:hypothetical protein PHAVU_011G202432 [Phaseolus vulgaris]